jgi:hypothetical protein
MIRMQRGACTLHDAMPRLTSPGYPACQDGDTS